MWMATPYWRSRRTAGPAWFISGMFLLMIRLDAQTLVEFVEQRDARRHDRRAAVVRQAVAGPSPGG